MIRERNVRLHLRASIKIIHRVADEARPSIGQAVLATFTFAKPFQSLVFSGSGQ